MKYLPLIWSGMWRKRGRTVLIALQVLIAFMLFGLLQGMKTGIDQSIASVGGDLLEVHTRQGWAPLPLAHLTRIKSVPGVKSVIVQNHFAGTYQKPEQKIFALATNPESLPTMVEKLDFVVKPEAIDALSRTRTGVLVGVTLAQKYGWKKGDHIPIESTLRRQDGAKAWALDVVGTFEDNFTLDGKNSEFLIINNDYFNEARAEQKNTVQGYLVVIDDPKQAATVSDAIDGLFANSPDETRTEPLREMAQAGIQAIGDVNFVVRAVVSAVLFALLFSVGAMMMQSLRERTPELAVLKTLGFTDVTIFWLILVEALLLCVLAALAGLGCATLIFPLAKKYLAGVAMPHSVLAAGVVIAAVLALVSAALPAWRGLRLQVADALAGR